MILEIFLYVIVLLYGIAIGSFLNVCIYRIPLGEEIVKTSSHCMTCGYQLRWYDNIPIISYLILGGKCRKCGTKLSVQYPLIEASNGLLYVLIFLVNGFNIISIVYCLLGSVLIVLGVIDERNKRIPRGLLVCIFILGIAITAIDYRNWSLHLIGLVAVSLVLALIHRLSCREAVTLGDVFLMAFCGMIIGWQLIIMAFFLGIALAAMVYFIRKQRIASNQVITLGPYLAIAVMITALWGYPFIGWYVQFLVK